MTNLSPGPATAAGPASARPPTLPPFAHLPLRRRVVIFWFLLAAMFMSTLDHHIVSTALPTIVGEFGAFERFGWVSSAYLLAQCSIMPVYGKLGDLLGRKYVMMAAVAIFTVGSLACGLAWSMNSLIAARVLQGFGGGGIMVSMFSIAADLFEPRERAKYQSFASLVIMASGSLGPTVGGGLSQAFGWRSIFLVNLPLGIAVLAGLWFMLPFRRPDRKPVIDYAGAAALAGTVACTVLWADSSQLFGSLFASPSLGILVLAVGLGLLWVRIERRAPEPIVPLALFRNPTFPLLLIVALTTGGFAIGMVNYHALFLQMTTGLAPAKAGLFFIAVTGGIAAGSLLTGRLIAATGRYKPWLVIGLTTSVLMLFTLSQLPLGVPFWLLAAILLVQGVAIGLGQQAPVLGVQTAAPARDVGAATGAVTLARIGGASLAIAVYGSILSAQIAAMPQAEELMRMTPAALANLPAEAQLAVKASFSQAFGPLYMAGAALALVALVAALWLRPAVLPMAVPVPGPGGARQPAE